MYFIIDGPSGVGKTTLINSLKEEGYITLSSPSSTNLSKLIRDPCRGVNGWENIDPKVQFMLFSAARLDEYIRIVHNNPKIIVADRWWTSTYVYQCIFQGVSVDFLEHTKHPGEKIDLVILLDGDDDVLIDRVNKEREMNLSHKRCTFTKNEDTQRKIISIYRNELRKYLFENNIKYEIINTTSLSKEEVKETAKYIISHRFIISRIENQEEFKKEEENEEQN